MNLKQLIKERVGDNKYPTLKRIKIGRGLFLIANLPLMTAWLYPIAIPMMMPMSPSLWAKSKLISFKEWRSLR